MNKYLSFLKYVVAYNPKFQSDFCRYNAKLVAEAASRGHITCLDYEGKPVKYWKGTHRAYDIINACKGFYGED